MSPQRQAFLQVMQTLENAARESGRPAARLLAVSKTQPADAIALLATWGQRDFGENYVQEALGKITALNDTRLCWHLIGRLQSNKCREVAEHFDWVQSLDRARLIEPLDRWRPSGKAPLDILVQVNPDGQPGKSGCPPSEIMSLAREVDAAPGLRLRGLMAIPEPSPDAGQRRQTFARLRGWFGELQAEFAGVDTLSMGMSEDYRIAVDEGATLVRIGSLLFGPRA